MTTIEYLSLPLHKRIIHRILSFFTSIPIAILNFFKMRIPQFFTFIWNKIISFFSQIYSNFADGDWKTRTSYLVMGFGLITRKSFLRGLLYLIYEIVFILFTINIGIPSLLSVGSFGYVAQTFYMGTVSISGMEVTVPIYNFVDDSFLILLNCIFFVVLSVVFVILWFNQIRDSSELQNLHKIGRNIEDKEIVKSLVGKNYHMVLLSIPRLCLQLFL